MANKASILEGIKKHIRAELMSKFNIFALNDNEIEDDTDLFEEVRGFDSIDALELLVMLEEYYQIEDSYDDIGIEFLRSITSLSEYVYALKYDESPS